MKLQQVIRYETTVYQQCYDLMTSPKFQKQTFTQLQLVSDPQRALSVRPDSSLCSPACCDNAHRGREQMSVASSTSAYSLKSPPLHWPNNRTALLHLLLLFHHQLLLLQAFFTEASKRLEFFFVFFFPKVGFSLKALPIPKTGKDIK